jgi:hypothetical protein
MRPERKVEPQLRSHHPLCWEASLQALRVTEPADPSAGLGSPQRYLQQVGIVPTGALLRAMTGDPRSTASFFPSGDHGWSGNDSASRLTGAPDSSRPGRSSSPTLRTSSGRACLASHLDRLRGKLRCHGLDVGTVLLFGRSAHGYLLLPREDGFYEEG